MNYNDDSYARLMFRLANDDEQAVLTGDGTILANCSVIGCDEWVPLARTLDDLYDEAHDPDTEDRNRWRAVRGIVSCHRHSVALDGPYVHHYGTEMYPCELCDDLVREGYRFGKMLEALFVWLACPG